MKPIAYIETSVVSYLTARQSRDVVVAAYQEVAREWWRTASGRFDLVASELVVTESGAGDVEAASARLEVLRPVALLDITENSEALTRLLLDLGAVPPPGRCGCRSYRPRSHQRRGLSGNMELQAYRECIDALPDRTGMPAGWL